MARGGLKFLRGAVADYVSYFMGQDGRGCLDHGYYGEGQRWTVSAAGRMVEGEWTARQYAAWLAGADPVTGEQRGRALHDGELRAGVRGYEYGVNVPKSASVAAMLDPELMGALAAAQQRAAVAGVRAVRAHARVRVSVAGRQQLVGVDALEVAVFGHDGSREGDPHLHLHVQVGAKALVGGQWRALAGRQMVGALRDWQATVGAALATDPGWVAACARRGLTVGPDGGVVEIGPTVEALFSKRNAAIRVEREELLAAFHRAEGYAPNARQVQWIDQQAWNRTRPGKGERELLTGADVRRILRAAGQGDVVARVDRAQGVAAPVFHRDAVVAAALEVAAQQEVLTEEGLRLAAAAGVAGQGGSVEDIDAVIVATTAAVRAQCVPARLPGGQDVWVPGSVMASARTVQDDLAAIRGAAGAQRSALAALRVAGLSPGQRLVAEAVAAGLPIVVEGPAGTGKTTALRRALDARNAAGLATVAIAPSRTAVEELGEGWTRADTAHGLLVRAGWTPDGATWMPPVGRDGDAALRDAVVVVDEAAMLDLHTMAAVTSLVRDSGGRVVLVGDDRQLAPVGVSGGFALARTGSDVVALVEAKRFLEPAHAQLASSWRSGGDLDLIADAVMDRGIVRVHASQDDAEAAVAEIAAANRNAIVMVADNATAVSVNRLVRAEHQHAGRVGPAVALHGRHGEEIGVGDRVQTRSNDRVLGVINRQRWIVESIDADGSMGLVRADQDPHARGAIRTRVDGEYAARHVQRADAVTVHAAQGATADAGHALIDDSWSREQAYVALTRGRRENVLHVVAEDGDDARAVLVRVLASSDAARAAALVAVVAERARQARVEITPGIAERIEAGLRRLSSRVGSWGSGSTLTASPGIDAPVADVPAVRPPVADL